MFIHVSELLCNADSLGQSVIDTKAIENINKYVFKFGVRQTLVEDRALRWSESKEKIHARVETCLSDCAGFESNLFTQLADLNVYQVLHAPVVESSSSLTETYMKKNLRCCRIKII